MKNITKLFIISFFSLIVIKPAIAKQEVTIWFIANIGVGIEQWVATDGKYKYYNNRPHWVELRKTYNARVFMNKKDCETHLLQEYSSVWQSGGSKTIVGRRDSKASGDWMSNMHNAEEKGFFTTKDHDWDNELVQFKGFYTCGSQTFNVESIKW